MTTWIIAGGMMVVIYGFYRDAYATTGLKVFLGCLSFGLFGGMLSYLGTEYQVIDRLEGYRGPGGVPKRFLPVNRKLMFFIITLLTFMSVVILLMVTLDIWYLLKNKNMPEPEIYWGVVKEIIFALVVLLGISLAVLGRYSRNLKRVLSVQIDAMNKISQGNLDARVPVMTSDEFAQIAAKTNDMITGLRERNVCQSSFEKYLSPEVSEKILKGEISPAGETTEATILFCDLRGYTSFVEKTAAAEVVLFLNGYFSEMERIIRNHGGIVLQYIGDEIEAVFGPPFKAEHHPDRAVAAAVDMRSALERLNRDRRGAGKAPVAHGIGIHTGWILAGNVGSPERLVYAMVGDTVNLASRLQVLNKTCNTDILVSRTTRELITSETLQFSSMGKYPIKGKSSETEVFSVRRSGGSDREPEKEKVST